MKYPLGYRASPSFAGILRSVRSRAALLALGLGLSQAGLALETGCGNTGMSSGTYTIPHGSLTRTFRLHVPAGYDKNRASRLIMIFHGWGGDENELLNDRTVIDEANARGYILVAPRGLGSGPPDHRQNSWTFRGSATGADGDGINPRVAGDTGAICNPTSTPDYRYPSCGTTARNSCSWTQCQDDDVAFAIDLLHRIESTMCVDAKHVFATGGSNGGMFTWELGQNPASAQLFSAIAPLIGLPHRGYLAGPGVAGRMPSLLITGVLDPTVPPGAWDSSDFTITSNGDDRFYYTGATAIIKTWSAAQGCNTAGAEKAFKTANLHADCRSYCAAGASGWPAVLDCRAEMGHDYQLSWSWKLILDFFDRS